MGVEEKQIVVGAGDDEVDPMILDQPPELAQPRLGARRIGGQPVRGAEIARLERRRGEIRGDRMDLPASPAERPDDGEEGTRILAEDERPPGPPGASGEA